jgi:hypothetical protein
MKCVIVEIQELLCPASTHRTVRRYSYGCAQTLDVSVSSEAIMEHTEVLQLKYQALDCTKTRSAAITLFRVYRQTDGRMERFYQTFLSDATRPRTEKDT